jgi:hypothetical protein
VTNNGRSAKKNIEGGTITKVRGEKALPKESKSNWSVKVDSYNTSDIQIGLGTGATNYVWLKTIGACCISNEGIFNNNVKVSDDKIGNGDEVRIEVERSGKSMKVQFTKNDEPAGPKLEFVGEDPIYPMAALRAIGGQVTVQE